MSSVPLETMIDRCCAAGSGAGRSSLAMVAVTALMTSSLDAGLGLGQTGDARRELPGALGEKTVEVLHGHSRELRDAAQTGGLAGAGRVLAAEADHLPVLGRERA